MGPTLRDRGLAGGLAKWESNGAYSLWSFLLTVSDDAFIETTGLSRVYTCGKVEVAALQDVTMSVARGRLVGVTGASGSGKSTLMNLLGGLDSPSAGTIRVDGRLISDLSKRELALYRRNTVGMIFQSFNLVNAYTALENVALPLLFAGVAKSRRREQAAELLQAVGLEARKGHRPTELSGGEQQRVAIARALVNQPQVLLADEPTGNLDSRTSRQIMEILSDLNRNRGLTIVMISHEQDLLRELAHEVISLQDGMVVAHERVTSTD
jgi:putative ABC transport system ATP-binding protein